MREEIYSGGRISICEQILFSMKMAKDGFFYISGFVMLYTLWDVVFKGFLYFLSCLRYNELMMIESIQSFPPSARSLGTSSAVRLNSATTSRTECGGRNTKTDYLDAPPRRITALPV